MTAHPTRRARRAPELAGPSTVSLALALAIMLHATFAVAELPAPKLDANPPVKVVPAPGAGSAAGTMMLVNATDAPVTVGSLVRDATCAAAITATPAGGVLPFTIANGASKVINLGCAAAQPSGLQRCLVHAFDQSASPLADFEVACEYASMSTLVPTTTSLTFGTVTVGNTVTLPVAVSNQSPTLVTRLFFQTDDLDGNFKIGAPCNPDDRACDALVTGVSIGNSSSFHVSCSPVSPGPHVARLYVASNTGQHLTGTPDAIDLSCTGGPTASPVVSVTPRSIDLGAVEVIGAMAGTGVHLANVGSGALQVTDVRIVDAGNGAAADWAYVASGACSGTIPAPCTLTAGQHVDLEVSFDPGAIGARDATLLIAYHDTADRSVSVALSGLGRGATLGLVDPTTRIDFGLVPVNVTSQVTFQLANDGNRAVTDVALGITPSGMPFALSPPAAAMVSTTMPTTITATCKPTAAGTFTATLQASAPDAFMTPPIEITATCEGSTAPLYALPSTLQLGEIRTATSPSPTTIMLMSTGAPVSVTAIALESSNPDLAVAATLPAVTPAQLELVVDPVEDRDLADAILVTASNGNTVRIPITGKVVTASYLSPPAASLGTFCVNQPTAPGPIQLRSTGTATIRLLEPAMDGGTMSPFDLTLIAPTLYPSTLRAGAAATVQIAPKRQALAGVHTDDLVWTTDVATMTSARTPLTATFVDNGGAIAPPMLAFGQVPIHIDVRNGQNVTLQNCDVIPVTIAKPSISAPFSVDSPNLPTVLMPNESATFSVGFHPTRAGVFSSTMTIESPQLDGLLVVALVGEGIAGGGGDADGGTDGGTVEHTSFYACGGCSSDQPAGVILVVLAGAGALVPPRRRRRRSR